MGWFFSQIRSVACFSFWVCGVLRAENVKKESGDEFSFSVQSLMNSSRLSVVLMLRVRFG